MTTKVNGFTAAGEFVTGGLEFYTITTAVNVLPNGVTGGSASTQAALDTLVGIISLRGQPIILGQPYTDGTNYFVKFAIEHVGAWATATPDLVASIVANAPGMGFTSGNTSYAIAETL